MNLGLFSTLLIIGMVQGAVFAALLIMTKLNRTANRLLAALLVLLVITLVPSALGFAGAYDRFPWLSFAPLTVTLGYGPLLWLYAYRLLRGCLPPAWLAHFVPLLLQVGYYTVVFVQPLSWRGEFNAGTHVPLVMPIEAVLGLTSALVYWVAAWRLYRRYEQWVPQTVSDSENYGLEWLRRFLLGTSAGFAVWAAFALIDGLYQPLSYEAFFGLDLLAAVLIYGLAIAGYRRADLSWPAMPPSGAVELEATLSAVEPEPGPVETPEWGERAARLEQLMRSERWFEDAELSIDSLARLVGTNAWALSQTVNRGVGSNFNDFVNSLRVEAVQLALRGAPADRTLLEIAHACGFNSKTSFNRSFKKLTGVTPSEYRKRVNEVPDPELDVDRADSGTHLEEG